MKIVKSLKNAGFLIKVVPGTAENQVKDQKGGLLGMLATLGESLLGNVLADRKAVRGGDGIIRVEQMKEQIEQDRFLMPSHSLTNFEIQQYYQNEPRFNGVYSKNDFPKIKDGHML